MRQVEHRRSMDGYEHCIDWRCDETSMRFDNICCASAMLCASSVGNDTKVSEKQSQSSSHNRVVVGAECVTYDPVRSK